MRLAADHDARFVEHEAWHHFRRLQGRDGWPHGTRGVGIKAHGDGLVKKQGQY